MPDTLLLQKISELKGLQDSAIIHLNKIDHIVSGLKSESIFYKLLPLIGVLLGGLITWWIQKDLKEKEFQLTIFREIKEISNKILNSLTNLQFQLKELAYLEVDSKYQFYIYNTSPNEKEKQRAYEEHYSDYKYITDVKNKVSMFVAEVNSNFSAHYKLSKIPFPDSLQTRLSEFTKHIFYLKREKEFASDEEVTTEMLQNKINNLCTDYVQHIDGLLDIVKDL